MAKVLATGLCLLMVAPPASAQSAFVELVAGEVATTGTGGNTRRLVNEGARLVPGTLILLGNDARAVLIQTVSMPGGPPGGSKLCSSWAIIGGVERFRVRNISLTSSGGCPASPPNISIPDATTTLPFVQQVTFVEFAHDKADLPAPAMLTRLRAAADSMRITGSAPDRDLSISHTLIKNPPSVLLVAGTATNRSPNFYHCVRLRFGLFRKTADEQFVRVDTLIVSLSRVRAKEDRKFQRRLPGNNVVSLESVGLCE